MKYIDIKGTDLKVSRIAQGCMRIAGLASEQLDRMIKTDIDSGINFFDHADIYGRGKCESVFGDYLKQNPALREQMIIQTKCGIRKGMYDFSAEHITSSVNGSLKRLGVDHIDVLLLHRPDALIQPEVVGEIFDKLNAEGKVKYFGVSNFNSMQIELLQKSTKQRLIFNQLQFGPAHAGMAGLGLNVNTNKGIAVDRTGMILDYCRLNDIIIQPWSPFNHIRSNPLTLTWLRYRKLNSVLARLAKKYNVTKSCIVIAWILRHPAGFQPIIGSTSPRIAEMAKATDIDLTREEWYEIYTSANGRLQ